MPALAVLVLYQYLSWMGLAALAPPWSGGGHHNVAPHLEGTHGPFMGRSSDEHVWQVLWVWLGTSGVSVEALWSTGVAALFCWTQVGSQLVLKFNTDSGSMWPSFDDLLTVCMLQWQVVVCATFL